jgi:hypothetical protein
MARGLAILYNSNFDITQPFSDVSVQMALATGTAQSYTVPGNAHDKFSVRFGLNHNSNVFIGNNVTAASPGAGDKTTTQFLELNPGHDGSQRYVKGGDVLSFVTPDTAAYVSISIRQLP